jgi:protein-tyrosine phosphatase
MVDIHSHICYGVDDGSRTLDESLAMLKIAIEGGTTDIVATPHSDLKFHFNPALVRERIAEIQERIGDRIRIHRGCDFHLFFDNIRNCLEDRSNYTINGKRYLMVEFADSSIPKTISDVFTSLLQKEITPVITHPERNPLLMGRLGDMVRWIRSGCLIQVTAASFTGRFGKSAEANAQRLMDQKMVHFVASDAHDTEWRPPDLQEARRIVTEGWGGEIAERLFETYPRIALTDQYIDCEDPDDVVEKKSFFGFLKKAQSR